MTDENDIATDVLDICFFIHRQYGPGLFESVYEEILCYELAKEGYAYVRQQAIPVVHEAIRMEVGYQGRYNSETKGIVGTKKR